MDLTSKNVHSLDFFVVFAIIVPILIQSLPSFPNTCLPDFGSKPPPFLDILDFDFC